MARSDERCATGGCENVPRIGHAFCDRCAARHAATQRAADEQDTTTLFGSSSTTARTRAALPEHMANPVDGKAATSKKAAAAVAGAFHTRKQLIHEHIKQHGATGATRPEIADALRIPVNSVNSAANTLYRQGLIASNPEHERPDPVSGQACAVLVDEAHVERWKGKPRRERSALSRDAFSGGRYAHTPTRVGECDLVHPTTGEPMTLGELAKLLGIANKGEQ